MGKMLQSRVVLQLLVVGLGRIVAVVAPCSLPLLLPVETVLSLVALRLFAVVARFSSLLFSALAMVVLSPVGRRGLEELLAAPCPVRKKMEDTTQVFALELTANRNTVPNAWRKVALDEAPSEAWLRLEWMQLHAILG